MFRFFRKIRHALVRNGSVSKYIFYAIGEIALVVIGILIALAINNWNEDRIAKGQAIAYLRNLKQDLERDINAYRVDLDHYETEIGRSTTLLGSDDYKKLGVDSIVKLLTGNYTVNRVADQTFEKIKNAGVIELLDISLDRAINSYYNTEVRLYLEIQDWDKQGVVDDHAFWFNGPYFESGLEYPWTDRDFAYRNNERVRNENAIRLVESIEGRNRLRNALTRDEYAVQAIRRIRAIAESIIEAIDEELAKHE